MDKLIRASMLIILMLFIAGSVAFWFLPDSLPIHWDIHGNPNAYASKSFALFFLPSLSFIILLILWWLPNLDPLKKNIMQFKEYYYYFIFSFIIFLAFVYAITLMEAFGFSTIKLIILGVAFLFMVIALLLGHSKQNWFIGIRTPWTMSDERVWEKTNLLGSKLFKVLAVVLLVTLFLPAIVFLLTMVIVIAISVFLVVYSYWIFKKQ